MVKPKKKSSGNGLQAYFDVLKAFDQGDYEYWNRMDEDAKKKISVFNLIQWMSAICDSKPDFDEARRQGRVKGDGKGPWPQQTTDNGATENYIHLVNELINQDFFTIIKKPDVAARLMAFIGRMNMETGFKPSTNTNHLWIHAKGLSATPKLDAVLLEIHPLSNAMERNIMRDQMNIDDIRVMLQSMGWDDGRMKDIISEIQSYKKKVEENGTL